MTTAVVTGAGGFIGRHLCAHLVAVGSTVKVITSGEAPANTEVLGVAHGSQAGELAESFSGIDVVYHLAGLAHEGIARNNATTLQKANVDGALAVFEASVQAGVPAMVWLSSIKVLGDTSRAPLRTTDPYQPGDAYAQSKVSAERALLGAGAGNTRLAIVRPPLVYGPGVRGNFLRMLQWTARGVPLPLARASAPRSMVGVANLCDLLVRLGHRGTGVYHVADPEDSSVAELLGDLAAFLGQRLRLFGVAPGLIRSLATAMGQQTTYSRLFDPLQVDQSTTQKALDWQPPHDRHEQLEATVRWFQQQR